MKWEKAIEIKDLYFEDINVGDEIPPITKKLTLLLLAQYSASTWDFHYAHIDKEFAKARGLPGNHIDGQEFGAFLAQMITQWAGPNTGFKKMGMTYRILAIQGDTVICKGKVKEKCQKDGENLINCELWVENQRNEKVVSPAHALITVMSRTVSK